MFVTILIQILLSTNIQFYIAGYFGSISLLTSMWLLKAMVFLLLFILMFVCLFELLKNKNIITFKIYRWRVTILILISTLLLGIISLKTPNWWVTHAKGMAGWVQREGIKQEAANLRKYLMSLNANGMSQKIPKELWPDFIAQINPQYCYWYKELNDLEYRVLEMSWGGGFIGPFGIAIYSENAPERKISKSEYRIKLCDGIYVYHHLR